MKASESQWSNQFNITLQKQIGCFNHRVVTQVADKQWLWGDYKHWTRGPKDRGPKDPRTRGPGTQGPEDPRTGDRGPEDQGPNDLALLYLAFMTEIDSISY